MHVHPFLFSALGVSSLLLAGTAWSSGTPSGTSSTETSTFGTPVPSQAPAEAGLAWGDVDGDGLPDALAIGARGEIRLLLNFGAGRFEDITERSGLSAAEGASCALFTDLDGDGRADLFLGSSTTRLWRNLGDATFEPLAGGVEHDLVDLSVQAVDPDENGLVDLQIHTEAGDLVYRNLGQGRFERMQLPLGVAPVEQVGGIAAELPGEVEMPGTRVSPATGTPAQRRLGRWAQHRATGLIAAPGPSSSSAPLMTGNLDAIYVNDNMNEVDSADIVDGSLTGADVSTSSGDVTFSGATVTARKGVFGVGSTASGAYSTVSGGYGSTATGSHSAVSGGFNNGATGSYSAISGGFVNDASGGVSTVSGGVDNTASGIRSTVSGGASNTASGDTSTVSGGDRNTAGGDFSFAAGRKAKANHTGSFVWGDSVDVDKTSSATDQFNVYAEGGMRVFAVGQSTPSMQVTATGSVTTAGSLTTGGSVGVGTATPQGGLSVFAQKTTATPTEQGVHMGREVGGYANSTVIEIVSANSGLPAVDFNALGSGQADFGARIYWDRPSDTLFVLGANLCATVACPSSERFKENVTPLMGALEAVLQLEGVRFDWRPEEAEKRGFTHDFGFIAEQVQEVIPEVVLADEDGLVIGMDYARLSAFLVEAMKEQQRTIAEQQQAFEAQQREIEALRGRASELEHLQSEIELLKASLAALAAR